MFSCVWWFNFDCGSSVELYARNAALYISNPAPRQEDATDNTLDEGGVMVSGPTPLPASGLQRRRRGNYRHVQLEARRQ